MIMDRLTKWTSGRSFLSKASIMTTLMEGANGEFYYHLASTTLPSTWPNNTLHVHFAEGCVIGRGENRDIGPDASPEASHRIEECPGCLCPNDLWALQKYLCAWWVRDIMWQRMSRVGKTSTEYHCGASQGVWQQACCREGVGGLELAPTVPYMRG